MQDIKNVSNFADVLLTAIETISSRYINSLPASNVPVLYEDFENGVLTGISLNAESDYSIFTVGVDRYGVESGVFRVDFSTPAPEIVGNPQMARRLRLTGAAFCLSVI